MSQILKNQIRYWVLCLFNEQKTKTPNNRSTIQAVYFSVLHMHENVSERVQSTSQMLVYHIDFNKTQSERERGRERGEGGREGVRREDVTLQQDGTCQI